MATLKENVYTLIKEYQNKPETNENMVCLGLQEIPTGFYVFIIPDKELPECQNDSLVERTIHDFFNYEKTHFELKCLYNDKIRTSFKKPISEISALFSAYVPKSKVQEHEFLKLLLETEEQEENYQRGSVQRINELGLDESEAIEGMHSDAEETRQNEFENENRIEDDFEDESE